MKISKHTEKQRRYYENNREAWNKYQREYKKRKYNEDPEYRLRVKEYAKERNRKLKEIPELAC